MSADLRLWIQNKFPWQSPLHKSHLLLKKPSRQETIEESYKNCDTDAEIQLFIVDGICQRWSGEGLNFL